MNRLSATVNLGPLAVPIWLFSAIIAVILSYGISAFLGRKRREIQRQTADTVSGVLIIFFLVWKISPVVFSFRTVVEAPLSLLYLPGGTWGTVVGALGALLYLSIKLVRARPIPSGFTRLLSFHFAAACVVFLAASLLLTGANRANDEQLRAPEFSLVSLQGENISLSDFSGRYVILNFWASWCPPCRAEIPELVRFYNEIEKNDRVVLLAVNQTATEKSLDAVAEFAGSFRMEFPILLDTANQVHSLYGIRGIPTTYIVDPEGYILTKRTGAVTRSWLSASIR